MRAIQLRPGGVIASIDIPDTDSAEQKLRALQKAVGGYIQYIPMGNALGKGYQMIVDEEYLLKSPHIDNPHASLLYKRQIGQWYGDAVIYGNALIVKDRETPDGIETIGLTDEEIPHVMAAIAEAVTGRAA